MAATTTFPILDSSGIEILFRENTQQIKSQQGQAFHHNIVDNLLQDNIIPSSTITPISKDAKQLRILRKEEKKLKLKQVYLSLPKRRLRSHKIQTQPMDVFVNKASNIEKDPQKQIAEKENSDHQVCSSNNNQENEQQVGKQTFFSDEYQSIQAIQLLGNKQENILPNNATSYQPIDQMNDGSTDIDTNVLTDDKQNLLQTRNTLNQQLLFPYFDDFFSFQPLDQCYHELYIASSNICPISNEADLFQINPSLSNVETLDFFQQNLLNEGKQTKPNSQNNLFEGLKEQQKVLDNLKTIESEGINAKQNISNDQECQENSGEIQRNHWKQEDTSSIQQEKQETLDGQSKFHNNLIKNIMSSFSRFIVTLFRHSKENVECEKKNDQIRCYFGSDNEECELPLEKTCSTIIEIYNQSTRGKKSDDKRVFVKKYLKTFRTKRCNMQSFEQLVYYSSYASVFIYYLENFVFNWLHHSKITNQGIYHKFINQVIEKARILKKID